jgi:hypothetical protein
MTSHPGSGLRVRSVEGATANPSMMALCYASLLQHVIQPNRRRGLRVEVFGHSWSPEIAGLLDALFQPTRSLHEPARTNLVCPAQRVLYRECLRTVSHLLGIRRSIELKMAEERQRGITYDSVYIGRWDVLWNRPLSLPSLPGWTARTANTFWLPHHCSARNGEPSRSTPLKSAICGGGGKGWRGPQGANECRSDHRPCQGDMSLEARDHFLLDWWTVASSSAAADTFCIGMHANHTALMDTMIKRLSRFRSDTSRATPMGHTFWGLQMIQQMNASIVWTRQLTHDFALGRMWQKDTCPAFRTRCLQQRRCGLDDVLRRPWQSWPISEQRQWPAPVTFPGPRAANPMRYSCSENFFACSEGSKMCVDAQRAAAPLERHEPRALYAACSESLCQLPNQHVLPRSAFVTRTSGRMDQGNGSLCAGLLLDTLVEVMANAPPANASLAPRTRMNSTGAHHTAERQSALPALKERAAVLLASAGLQAPAERLPQCARATLVSSRGATKLPQPLTFGRCDAAIEALPQSAGRTHMYGRTDAESQVIEWGDCLQGAAGGWQRDGLTMEGCEALCDRCKNCFSLSHSLVRGECLWAQECTHSTDRVARSRVGHEGYSFISVLRKEAKLRLHIDAKKKRNGLGQALKMQQEQTRRPSSFAKKQGRSPS